MHILTPRPGPLGPASWPHRCPPQVQPPSRNLCSLGSRTLARSKPARSPPGPPNSPGCGASGPAGTAGHREGLAGRGGAAARPGLRPHASPSRPVPPTAAGPAQAAGPAPPGSVRAPPRPPAPLLPGASCLWRRSRWGARETPPAASPAAPGHAPPGRSARARGCAPGRGPGRPGRGPAPGARGRGPRAGAPAAFLEEHRLLVSTTRGSGGGPDPTPALETRPRRPGLGGRFIVPEPHAGPASRSPGLPQPPAAAQPGRPLRPQLGPAAQPGLRGRRPARWHPAGADPLAAGARHSQVGVCRRGGAPGGPLAVPGLPPPEDTLEAKAGLVAAALALRVPAGVRHRCGSTRVARRLPWAA